MAPGGRCSREQRRVLGSEVAAGNEGVEPGFGAAMGRWDGIVSPCVSPCSLDPSSSPCSGCTAGVLSWKGEDGGGRASEHPLAGAGEMREGCGAAANYRRCPSCGIDRGSAMGHRPTFPAGSPGNEPGHRGSRLPRLSPRQPRGYLGQGRPQGHGAARPPPWQGAPGPWGWVCSRGLM